MYLLSLCFVAICAYCSTWGFFLFSLRAHWWNIVFLGRRAWLCCGVFLAQVVMCVAQKECFWVCDKSFHHVPSHGKHHCNGRSNSNKGTNNIRGVHIKSKRHGETDRSRENKGFPFLYGFTETPTRRMLRLTIIWPTVYVPSAIAHHQDHRLMWGVDLFANCRYRRTFGKGQQGKPLGIRYRTFRDLDSISTTFFLYDRFRNVAANVQRNGRRKCKSINKFFVLRPGTPKPPFPDRTQKRQSDDRP